MLCYNQSRHPPTWVASRRGVAQPGRAPGSGPGGRRFKSSLPDHLFSVTYAPSESRKIPVVGKNATVLTSIGLKLKDLLKDFPKMHSALPQSSTNVKSMGLSKWGLKERRLLRHRLPESSECTGDEAVMIKSKKCSQLTRTKSAGRLFSYSAMRLLMERLTIRRAAKTEYAIKPHQVEDRMRSRRTFVFQFSGKTTIARVKNMARADTQMDSFK
jgi:hypothetical protein